MSAPTIASGLAGSALEPPSLLLDSTGGPRGDTVGHRHIRGLDGLRALSIAIVFIAHYVPVVTPNHLWLEKVFPGMFGVNIFFVISGLLISSILLGEYRATGTIGLRNFYIRRLLRLSPALLVYVAVIYLLYRWQDPAADGWAFIAAATYAANYYQAWTGGTFYHMPLWSLAVEEHFYLIAPAAMLLVCRWNPARLLPIAALAALGGLADAEAIYHRTDTRFDVLLFGLMLAVVMAGRPRPGSREGRLAALVRHRAGLGIGLGLIALSIVYRDEAFRMTFRYSLQGLGLFFVLGWIVFSREHLAEALRNRLEHPALRFLGRISYSLYLWHLTLLMFAVFLWPALPPLAGVGIGLVSIGVAIASYYWIEQPFLGLRRHFGSHVTA
jgi:peptidoglycan/LPS O-acetylase OafA/YrhL